MIVAVTLCGHRARTDVEQENSMTTKAVSIALGLQALRGEDVQAPRGGDVQAPRGGDAAR